MYVENKKRKEKVGFFGEIFMRFFSWSLNGHVAPPPHTQLNGYGA
jgi:hypothetical protein